MEQEYRDFRQLEHTGWERAASEYESRRTDLAIPAIAHIVAAAARA